MPASLFARPTRRRLGSPRPQPHASSWIDLRLVATQVLGCAARLHRNLGPQRLLRMLGPPLSEPPPLSRSRGQRAQEVDLAHGSRARAPRQPLPSKRESGSSSLAFGHSAQASDSPERPFEGGKHARKSETSVVTVGGTATSTDRLINSWRPKSRDEARTRMDLGMVEVRHANSRSRFAAHRECTAPPAVFAVPLGRQGQARGPRHPQ